MRAHLNQYSNRRSRNITSEFARIDQGRDGEAGAGPGVTCDVTTAVGSLVGLVVDRAHHRLHGWLHRLGITLIGLKA